MPKYKIIKFEEANWFVPIGMTRALAKYIVGLKGVIQSDNFEIAFSTFSPAGGFSEHIHKKSVQCYYILQGKGLFFLDGTEHLAMKGEFVYVPPLVKHALKNTSNEDLNLILVTIPPEVPKLKKE